MASEVRSRSWESDLGGQGRAGPSPSPTSEPSRPEEQGPHPAGALRVAESPEAAREHRPLGRQGRRGAPRERTGERGVPPSRGKGLRPLHPQAVVRELPKRLTTAHGGPGPAPRSPAPGSRCPRAVPRSLHLTAPDPCRPRSRSLPPSLLCAPEKFGPSSLAWSPALTREERSRSGRHAGAEGGGGRRRERRAPHSGPCCPCRGPSCKRGGGRRRVTCPLSHRAA